MEFRASLRNAQAEWLSNGRKIFQEEQQKNGKTMNGMDTAKGQWLNPLNCKYSKFVDSCVDRLNRMLRNGETTKEAVNTAKRYLYALKSVAAANGDRLTREIIEEEDCADSYNALLKQLAQIGGLSKPSKARTPHRKARDVRARARDSKAVEEGGKSTHSDEESVNLFNCDLLEVRSFFRGAVHGIYKFNAPPKAVEMAMVFLDKLCVLAITYGGAISMETLSKCDEYLVSESKVVLPILSKLKDQALKGIPEARQEWGALVTKAKEHPQEPKLNRDAYNINFNYNTNYFYDLTNALLSKRIISEDDGSSVKERLRSFQINEVSVKTVGFFGNSRITSVPVHDYQWETYADLLLYLMEFKRLAKENGLLLENGELTASGQKESQPQSGAETTSTPAAGGTPSIAARFLRRFLAMHGKTFNRSKASTLLRSLQRAIVGKEIRKTDRNAELIEQMQSALIRMLDGAWGSATVEFDAKTLAALQKSVNSEKQSQTVTLLRAYVGLNDTDDRAKAERLLRRMRKAAAVDGELSQEISAARQNLERFLSSGEQKRLEINPYELQGLCGLLGVDGVKPLAILDEKFRNELIDQVEKTLTSNEYIKPWREPEFLVNNKKFTFGFCNSQWEPYSLDVQFKLSMYARRREWQSPFFLTPNYVESHGGTYKLKDVVSVTYYYPLQRSFASNEHDVKAGVLMLINASDVQGIPQPEIKKVRFEPLETIRYVENIINAMAKNRKLPKITYETNDKCSYNPKSDTIRLIDDTGRFISSGEYYSTLFHEITHSTGHPSRLNRNVGTVFERQKYAFEELVAEIGSILLCDTLNITYRRANSLAYIRSWIDALRKVETKGEDEKWYLVKAYEQAAAAVEYLLEGIDLEKMVPATAKIKAAHSGLGGVDGTVYSGKDVQRMDFQTVKLEPRFAEFIGSPEFPFCMMVHGGPGSGKTTFALQLANSLAAHNGKRVLFVSSEEGIGQKLKSKIDRLGLHAPTLYFSSTLPDSFADYDAVFIDSVISMGLTAESLREMYRNAPNTTFVAINQETKDGKARGSLEITHDTDIACRCENLSATLEKNRYGDTSKIFAIIA